MLPEDGAMHMVAESDSHYRRDFRGDRAHITFLRLCRKSQVSKVVSHRTDENRYTEGCSDCSQLAKPAVSKAVLLRRFRADAGEYLGVEVRSGRAGCRRAQARAKASS